MAQHPVRFHRSSAANLEIQGNSHSEKRNRHFTQTHKAGNNGINNNFVFPYIFSCLHFVDHKMLVNVKLVVCW